MVFKNKFGAYLEFWRSLFFKVFAVFCSFLILPIMLRYLGGELFGVWVAIFSIVSWVIFFDLGLGSGLRNKLSKSLSLKDNNESAVLVATAYVAMAGFSFFVLLFFLVFNYFARWQFIFNTQTVSEGELQLSMAIMGLLFLLNFTLMLVTQVLHASQKTSWTVAHQFFANLTALITILGLKQFVAPSLLVICFSYGVSQLVATLFVSYLFYRNNYHLLPRLRFFKLDRIRDIMSLGGQFFIIQLAVLVIFSTDKIIIVKIFGPEILSEYELVFKMFSSILIMNALFLAPLWSGYTKAAAAKDFAWMRTSLYRSNLFALLLVVPTLGLCFFGRSIIFLWSGYNIAPDSGLLVGMCVLVVLRIWTDIYAYFLNGAGILKVQMWIAVFQALINVPLSIMLGHKFGVVGVVYGSVITLAGSAILLPICVYMYLKQGKSTLIN